jgi:integrase
MRSIHHLTRRFIETAKQGKHADGGNLYLQVKGNSKSWIFRYRNSRFGRPGWTELGIGPLHTYTLEVAREEAAKLRKQLDANIDPMAAKKAEKEAKKWEEGQHVIFAAVAAEYLEVMPKKKKWSQVSIKQAKRAVNKYLNPVIGQMLIGTITHLHLYEVLKEISYTKPPTAEQVQMFAQAIFNRARARGFPVGANPPPGFQPGYDLASMDGPLGELLPDFRDREVEHEPGIAYQKIGWLFAQLRTPREAWTRAFNLREAAEATEYDRSELLRAIHEGKLKGFKKPGTESLNTINSPWFVWPDELEKAGYPIKKTPDRRPFVPLEADIIQFQTLTAARPSEARMMRWSELGENWENKRLWTLPSYRHKTGRTTKEPIYKVLSNPAIEILKKREIARAELKAAGKESDFVFAQTSAPSSGPARIGKPMSDAKEREFLARLVDASESTLHGLRTTFKKWAVEDWGGENAEFLSEVALGHKTGNETRNSYTAGMTLIKQLLPMMEDWGKHCAGNLIPFPQQAKAIGDSHA